MNDLQQLLLQIQTFYLATMHLDFRVKKLTQRKTLDALATQHFIQICSPFVLALLPDFWLKKLTQKILRNNSDALATSHFIQICSILHCCQTFRQKCFEIILMLWQQRILFKFDFYLVVVKLLGKYFAQKIYDIILMLWQGRISFNFIHCCIVS